MHESGQSRSPARHFAGIESLSFSKVPRQSRLFVDYQNEPAGLRRYYPNAVSSPSDLVSTRNDVLDSFEADRSLLCDSLLRVNRIHGATPETIAAIEKLRNSDTVAVLTGQQAGLFTGPIYSIYKALTAIRVAESLNGRGVSAVAVFWAATEDHDHEEVSNTFVVDAADRLFECRMSFPEEAKGNSVGSVRLNDSISATVTGMFAKMHPSGFRAGLQEMLDRIWEPSATLGEVFGKTLSLLLGGYGLIVADPQDEGLKALAAPVYSKAIERRDEVSRALTERSEELERDGYHSQVEIAPDQIPLFWHDDLGRRLALRQSDGGAVKVRSTGQSFTDRELTQATLDEPNRFSPGVMLRPVVQDHIFPTICYIGGAAEIAYFAQNSEVYRVLGRRATPILHRQSFTFVESRHRRTIERYGLDLVRMFEGSDEVFPKVIDEVIDPALAAAFERAEGSISVELDLLERSLASFDVTLAADLATRRRKIAYHIDAARRKYHARRAESNEVAVRRLRAAFESLLPADGLQERMLNVFYFMNRLGPGFIGSVYDAIDLDDRGHRIVYL